MISGVVTEIYKKIYETAEKKRHASKAEIENASHEYDKSYRERHGQVKVFCVGMRKPISLDNVYVAVQFLNQHTASRYSSPEEVEQAFRTRRERHFDSTSNERQDGTQVANDEQYLMLLGGPGVGKSTFLRKVGLEALKVQNGNFEHECIPIFLELKRFTENQTDIEALIVEEFEICGFPHPEELTKTALESGKLLLLFDGLDEVPRSNVNNVIDKIADFVDRYSQNRFIASCRIAAYKGGFKRFNDVEMVDFDDSQIEAYIKNWFKSTPDPNRHQLDENMKTAEQCWTMLNASEHSATKELARNPLLLTLLCMVYDNSQNFQRNRASLYEDALNIFLREWLAEKRVNRGASITQYLDIADEKRMLSEIAAKNFEANRLFFSKDELITQIQEFGEGNANTLKTFSAPKILDTILIDQGLFVERVRGSYSFSHLTFQEYLTANYIVGHPQSIQGLVTGHLHDEQWREVFLLTSGLMYKADDLLIAMDAEAAKFINTDRLKTLFQWAKRVTNASDNRYIEILKREFVMSQYFDLWVLDKIYDAIKTVFNQYRKHHPELSIDQYLKHHPELFIDQFLSQDRTLYVNVANAVVIYTDFESDFVPYFHLYPNIDISMDIWEYFEELDTYLCSYPHLYLYCYQTIDLDMSLYQDLYQYMDLDLYTVVSPELYKAFNKELDERITVVEGMKKEEIFEEVDLQPIIQRFSEQQEFIKETRKSRYVKPPKKSIHTTWLSVLGITADMLAISREEIQSIVQYFCALQLILDCKAAAGRVSPDVWQKIEDRLLAWEIEESEDYSKVNN